MQLRSTTDQAIGLQLQRQMRTESARIADLGQALASGRVTDAGARLGGDFTRLAGLERMAGLRAALAETLSQDAGRLGAAQAALQAVSDAADTVMPKLLTAGNTGAAAHVTAAGAEADAAFAAAVDALNTRHAGASVLAGVALRSPAVAPAPEMLDRIAVLAGPGADAAALGAAAEAWFAPGGGFETDGWLGQGPAAPVRLGPEAGELGGHPPDAADARLRGTLAGLAMGALVARGLPADPAGRAALAEAAGSRLAQSAEPRAALRAELGLLEAAVAQAETRNTAAAAALDIARNDLTGADPYATATALQDTQGRMEMLYLMTARLSRLSLTEYLR